MNILAAESDLYVAMIDDKIIVKIGPREAVGDLVPPNFKLANSGFQYALWEKN